MYGNLKLLIKQYLWRKGCLKKINTPFKMQENKTGMKEVNGQGMLLLSWLEGPTGFLIP